MAKLSPTQRPLRIAGAAKRETRTQFAALPFRVSKKKGGKSIEILLISSLDSGRWIIPKGWPMDGLTPAEAAGQEAWEEAGIKGRVHEVCVGLYSYSKWIDEDLSLPVIVAVFPLAVKRLEEDFPEAGKRKRKWCSPKKAASRVLEPELKQLIKGFSLDRIR